MVRTNMIVHPGMGHQAKYAAYFRSWVDLCSVVGKSVKDKVETVDKDECAEHEEVAVVIEANAVVEPGTVVVHLEDTALADAAVVGAGGLGCYALLANCYHVLEFGNWYSAWIS